MKNGIGHAQSAYFLLRLLTVLVIFSLLSLAILTETVSAAKKIAFVVGIAKYKYLPADKQLDNSVNDAKAVADKLVELGFEVMSGMNLTRSDFNAKWQDVLDKTTSEDTLTFYYSGHGVEVDGQNFLLPHNIPFFKSSRHTQLKRESISVTELLADLRTGDRDPPKVTVMILDACRDDPTLSSEYKKGLGARGGLAKIPAPQGTFIMYSAAPGKVSFDRLGYEDKSKNSVYTRTLIPLLGNPSLSIQDLAIKVRQQVYELTNSLAYEQIPSYTDRIIGRFCLAGCQESDTPFAQRAQDFNEVELLKKRSEVNVKNGEVNLPKAMAESSDVGGKLKEQINKIKAQEMASLSAGPADVFFEPGSWALTQEGRQALAHTADWLNGDPSVKLLIEGHSDLRESPNSLGLGQKRAAAIRDYLSKDFGISSKRLSIISYGHHRQFCSDRTEICFQLNRRGHLVGQSP